MKHTRAALKAQQTAMCAAYGFTLRAPALRRAILRSGAARENIKYKWQHFALFVAPKWDFVAHSSMARHIDWRRCIECIATGALRAHEQAAIEDEVALIAAFDAAQEQERARLDAELARRRAVEPTDDECPICMLSIDAADRVVLHGEVHWVCGECCEALRASRIVACPLCRAKVLAASSGEGVRGTPTNGDQRRLRCEYDPVLV